MPEVCPHPPDQWPKRDVMTHLRRRSPASSRPTAHTWTAYPLCVAIVLAVAATPAAAEDEAGQVQLTVTSVDDAPGRDELAATFGSADRYN